MQVAAEWLLQGCRWSLRATEGLRVDIVVRVAGVGLQAVAGSCCGAAGGLQAVTDGCSGATSGYRWLRIAAEWLRC